MSTGGKIAVAGSIIFTTSIIYYVFATQEAEQKRMKKGVKLYLEEQQMKKARESKEQSDTNMTVNETTSTRTGQQ